MIKKAEEFKEEDNKQKELIETKNGLENYLYNLKNSMTKMKILHLLSMYKRRT